VFPVNQSVNPTLRVSAAELAIGPVKPAYVRTGGYRRLVQRGRTAARRLTGALSPVQQAARRTSGRCA
jgi:hypothetical protein